VENKYIFVAMKGKLHDSFLSYPKEYIKKIKFRFLWFCFQ